MPHPLIGLDYTAAVHQAAGIGRYVREMTRALVTLRPDSELRLFVAGARTVRLPPPPGQAVYRPSPLSERTHARLWHRLRLPLPVELWTGPLDLFHACDFTLPPTRSRVRTVLTIYDLAYERYPAETMPGMARYLSAVVPRSARRADHVIAISEATRADLIDLYHLPPEKISVAYPGVEPRFHPRPDAGEEAALRARYGLPEAPFVLTVGTLQPRKNHLRLVRAFARLEASLRKQTRLVIAGGAGWAYRSVQEEVVRLGLEEQVIFTGFVADADLPALYRLATVFAYPALYEGFGLPVLEAMACGVPVVAANTSSLPEITGPEAALLVDPFDVDGIASALARLLSDEALRLSLREKGPVRAGQFTWARTAMAVWGAYERLLEGF